MRQPAPNCLSFRAERTSCIRRSRSCKTQAVLFEHVSMARMTMRSLSDRFLEHYLDVVGDAATESVGAYQLEGLGIQLFRACGWSLFHHSGLAAHAGVGFPAATRISAAMSPAKTGERPFRSVPDRFARHGQIDGVAVFCRSRRSVHDSDAVVQRSTKAKPFRSSKPRFPDRPLGGKVDRTKARRHGAERQRGARQA